MNRAEKEQYLREYEVLKKKGKPFFPYAMFHDTVMSLVVVAVTWCPRATNCGTSLRPRTPVPPATNTLMIVTLPAA